MKTLYCYWDEWYTCFARASRRHDLISEIAQRKNIEVTDKFYDKYMTAKKEFEKLTVELIRKMEKAHK